MNAKGRAGSRCPPPRNAPKRAAASFRNAMLTPRRAPLLVACLWLAGCGAPAEEEDPSTIPGPTMRPGQNCLRCHSPGTGTGAPPWTAAGTVFPSHDANTKSGVAGVHVHLTDDTGKEITLTSNRVGNFYTDEPLVQPFHVEIEYEGERRKMPFAPPA